MPAFGGTSQKSVFSQKSAARSGVFSQPRSQVGSKRPSVFSKTSSRIQREAVIIAAPEEPKIE